MNRTLSIEISENDFQALGLTSEKVDYQTFIKRFHRQMALDALRKMQDAAAKGGISNMTLDEINAEIETVRATKRAQKNHH